MKILRHRYVQAAAFLIIMILGLMIGRTLWNIASLEIASVKPRRQDVQLPVNLIGAYQDITITTADNLKLAAWYAPTENGKTLLLLHGYGKSRMQVLREAELFRAQGYGVLLYDARAHGASEGSRVSFGQLEVLDLRAAIDWLEERPEVDPARIGAYGFSIGAGTLALEESRDSRLTAMVLASVPNSPLDLAIDESRHFAYLQGHFKVLAMGWVGVNGYKLEYGKAVEGLRGRPILMIQGGLDKGVSLRQSDKVFARAGQPKERIMLPHSGHGKFFETEDADLYTASLNSFFEKNL